MECASSSRMRCGPRGTSGGTNGMWMTGKPGGATCTAAGGGLMSGKTGGASGTAARGGLVCPADSLGRVLRIPCRGRFMCPFAVAALGLRYLRINTSVMFGHPSRKPRRTALRSDEIFGLHKDWWENLTALTRVRTECVKDANVTGMDIACAECGARSKQGPDRGRTFCPGVAHTFGRIGNVHRSVEGSLYPRKIRLPLNRTSHLSSSKTT